MKAVILAGGMGVRLQPHTLGRPKPLVPIGGRPILEIVLRQLKWRGFTDITLAVGHLSHQIQAYFGDGRSLGLRLTYSCEEEPLGTAGPLRQVPGLTERFLVMNGDVLTTLDMVDLILGHDTSGAVCTLAVTPRHIPIELGVVEHDAADGLVKCVEKPVHRFLASMGIYILEARVLDHIPSGRRWDMPDLLNQLVQVGEKVHCHIHDGYWLDIGRPGDHALAEAELEHLEPLLFPLP